MITYEEAKDKATSARSGLDTALEYKDAYVFYNSKARGGDREDNEVVILKKNGSRVSMSEYVMMSNDESTPKRLKF